jgi:hypothetical protein
LRETAKQQHPRHERRHLPSASIALPLPSIGVPSPLPSGLPSPFHRCHTSAALSSGRRRGAGRRRRELGTTNRRDESCNSRLARAPASRNAPRLYRPSRGGPAGKRDPAFQTLIGNEFLISLNMLTTNFRDAAAAADKSAVIVEAPKDGRPKTCPVDNRTMPRPAAAVPAA